MKHLALLACLFTTSLFAAGTSEKHYLNESQIQIFQKQMKFVFPDGQELILSDLHSDEQGIFATEDDIVEINLIEKRSHRKSDSGSGGHWDRRCEDCKENYKTPWDEQNHREDFQCREGPQGCARR